MRLLLQTWEEPCEGSATYFLDMNDLDWEAVENCFTFLENNAIGGEYGNTLPAWTLVPMPDTIVHSRSMANLSEKDDRVITTLDDFFKLIYLESRYGEDHTYYGDEPYAPLEEWVELTHAHPNSPARALMIECRKALRNAESNLTSLKKSDDIRTGPFIAEANREVYGLKLVAQWLRRLM